MDLERLLATVFDGLGFDVELTPPARDGGKDIVLSCHVHGRVASYGGMPTVFVGSGNAGGLTATRTYNVFVEGNNLTATKARLLLMASMRKFGSLPTVAHRLLRDRSVEILRAIASASDVVSLGTALRIVGISSARYHAWRRKEDGCGLDDQPSCPKSTPSQLKRDEVSTMRDFVESEAYRHIAVQNLALYAQRLGKLFASASTWYRMIRRRGCEAARRAIASLLSRRSIPSSSP